MGNLTSRLFTQNEVVEIKKPVKRCQSTQTTPIQEVCIKKFSLEEFKRVSHLFDITPDERRRIEEKTREQANNVHWHLARKQRITASRFHNASHLTQRGYEGFRKSILNPTPIADNVYMKWGRDHEDTAIQDWLYDARSEHVNLEYKSCGIFIDKEKPIFGASPDGLIECDCCGKGVLEVKCPYKYRGLKVENAAKLENRKWYLAYDANEQLIVNKDHPVYSQIQGQMKITERSYGYVIIWTTKNYKAIRVDYDEYFCNEMFDKMSHVYETVILPHI